MVKVLSEMTIEEQEKAYTMFEKAGCHDTLSGFTKMYAISTFNIKTGKIVECIWTTPLSKTGG